jgi:hypothetical protein
MTYVLDLIQALEVAQLRISNLEEVVLDLQKQIKTQAEIAERQAHATQLIYRMSDASLVLVKKLYDKFSKLEKREQDREREYQESRG